jgi:hypothetical protein
MNLPGLSLQQENSNYRNQCSAPGMLMLESRTPGRSTETFRVPWFLLTAGAILEDSEHNIFLLAMLSNYFSYSLYSKGI